MCSRWGSAATGTVLPRSRHVGSQLALINGPAVLGWSVWRGIDAEHGLGGSLETGLRACADAGYLRGLDIRALARLTSGALNEAVFRIAEAPDRRAAKDGIVPTLRAFLRRVVT